MENVHIIKIVKVNVSDKLFKGYYNIMILSYILLKLKLGMRQVKDFITDRVKKKHSVS